MTVIHEKGQTLMTESEKGYIVRNLRNMRQFYLAFPKRNTVCTELSWSHYRLLIRYLQVDKIHGMIYTY